MTEENTTPDETPVETPVDTVDGGAAPVDGIAAPSENTIAPDTGTVPAPSDTVDPAADTVAPVAAPTADVPYSGEAPVADVAVEDAPISGTAEAINTQAPEPNPLGASPVEIDTSLATVISHLNLLHSIKGFINLLSGEFSKVLADLEHHLAFNSGVVPAQGGVATKTLVDSSEGQPIIPGL